MKCCDSVVSGVTMVVEWESRNLEGYTVYDSRWSMEVAYIIQKKLLYTE